MLRYYDTTKRITQTRKTKISTFTWRKETLKHIIKIDRHYHYHHHHRFHVPGLVSSGFGLSYRSAPLPLPNSPAGLSPCPAAPILLSSSSSKAPGSCGSNIAREPGVRNGDCPIKPNANPEAEAEEGVRNGDSLAFPFAADCLFGVTGWNAPCVDVVRFRDGVLINSSSLPLWNSSSPPPLPLGPAIGGGSKCDL